MVEVGGSLCGRESRNQAPVSMTNPAQLEVEIHRLTERLEKQTDDLARLAQESAEKEAIYLRRYYTLILQYHGAGPKEPVAVKEARAQDQAGEERYAHKLAKTLYESGQEACRNTRAQLSALQSLLRSYVNQGA
jgi:hypothetical protein